MWWSSARRRGNSISPPNTAIAQAESGTNRRIQDMRDIIFVAVTVAFFLISIAYVKFCDRIRWGENAMDAESIIMLIVSAGLMVYLLYALLRPERF
jgi:K+-transporting ATPase KdpF subunit